MLISGDSKITLLYKTVQIRTFVDNMSEDITI